MVFNRVVCRKLRSLPEARRFVQLFEQPEFAVVSGRSRRKRLDRQPVFRAADVSAFVNYDDIAAERAVTLDQKAAHRAATGSREKIFEQRLVVFDFSFGKIEFFRFSFPETSQ